MATAKTIVTYSRDGTPTYMIDGKAVTKDEFDRILPSKPIAVPGKAHLPGAWPMISEAMGVMPDQIAEASAHAKAGGVPTEFTPDGRAILRDRSHRRELMKLYRFHDNHGGYSD